MVRSEVYWIEGPWSGRLAILPRPRGGDWLEDEVQAWRSAGVDVVVSTLGDDEIADLDLAQEASVSRAAGIDYVAFPVVDRGVPPSIRATADLVRLLESKLASGTNVGVHCRQGIGRSALLAGCVLIASGMAPEAAFERVAAARGLPVPETVEQRQWADRFARERAAATTPRP